MDGEIPAESLCFLVQRHVDIFVDLDASRLDRVDDEGLDVGDAFNVDWERRSSDPAGGKMTGEFPCRR